LLSKIWYHIFKVFALFDPTWGAQILRRQSSDKGIDWIQETGTMKRKKGFYSISAVAKMFSIHQQTIRLYEKEGLISPKRSEGNTRLFSEEDVDRLEQIIYLTHQVGVNLAGVEMILKLQRKIQKMQNKMNKLFENAHEELKLEQETSKEALKASAKSLMKLKQEASTQDRSSDDEQVFDIDSWEIEYDE